MANADRSVPESRGIQTNPLFRRVMFLLRFITQLRSWYIVRELRTLLNDSGAGSMLDAGCGYGEYSYYVASRHPELSLTSLEVDPKLAADFKTFAGRAGLSHVRVVSRDVLDLDENGAYDVILCGSVLEHIEDDERALKKLTESLRPGGAMIIYVPTEPKRILPYFRRMEGRANKRAGGSQFGHVRDYTREEIERKIASAGLAMRKGVDTYGFFGALAYEILYTFLPHSSRFSRRHWLILPLYFLLLHPFVMILMLIDLNRGNRGGNGFMGVAQRPPGAGRTS